MLICILRNEIQLIKIFKYIDKNDWVFSSWRNHYHALLHGFDPEELPKLFDEEKLQVTKWGTIKTDFDTMETNIAGIFAAGDIIRGASLVVWAIKDGRDAAESIQKYLELKEKQNQKVA